jgi:hypothetical protein
MFNLSIGILSWNSPKTLNNTLESYKLSGLFNISDDIICLIQSSELEKQEINICNNYNIKYILNTKNLGIAHGIKILIENSKNEYFLFLENDWVICKKYDSIKKLIDYSIELIKNEKFDVIRLRNLKNPGHPIHCVTHYRNKSIDSELYLCTHYLKNPHINYPDYIKLYNNNPIIYKISSKYCVYTNNPTIISKTFYNKHIKQFIVENKNLEPEIDPYWKTMNFKIGITNGLFTHIRLDGHDTIGSNYKKNCYCCPSNIGGYSDNLNCICCTQPYVPTVFNKNNLNDDLAEIIDEENIINNIFPNIALNYYSNTS